MLKKAFCMWLHGVGFGLFTYAAIHNADLWMLIGILIQVLSIGFFNFIKY